MIRLSFNLRTVNILAGLSMVAVVIVLYQMSAQGEQETTNYSLKYKIRTVPTRRTDKTCKGHVVFRNIYNWDGKEWAQNDQVCKDCHNFRKVKLKTPFGNTPIFIYESRKDIWNSAELERTGHFEASKINGIISLLLKDPTLDLIDIGANLGVYTLTIAKMGRKILAVEAMDRNVQHICASVEAGSLHNNVTIIHNAVADFHARVKLRGSTNNMGGIFVDVDSEHIKEVKSGRVQGTIGQVDTITMNDLVELPVFKDFSKVILKMDIEGFEHKALATSQNFFDALDVRGVAMEWEFHRGVKSGDQIIRRMGELNFEPYKVENPDDRLSVDASVLWPWDVLWRPKLET